MAHIAPRFAVLSQNANLFKSMKIIQETQNLIVLKDSNLWAWILGGVFVLAGVVMIVSPASFTNTPPAWAGAISILVGLAVILIIKSSIITLNKDTNQLSIAGKSIIGGQIQDDYALNQIKQVELQYSVSRQNVSNQGLNQGMRMKYSYRLVFILTDGREVPLTTSFSGASNVGGILRVKERAIGEKLSAFLGVPFIDIRPADSQRINIGF